MTGTGESTIFSMISRVDSTRPPGVLISISRTWAFFALASARARPMYSSVMGWMVSLRTILRTSALERWAAKRRTRPANAVRRGRENIRWRFRENPHPKLSQRTRKFRMGHPVVGNPMRVARELDDDFINWAVAALSAQAWLRQ